MSAAALLTKTKLCKFHIQGRCAKGPTCTFAHGQAEIANKPDFFRTQVCKTLINTGKCTNPTCRFAHNADEKRQVALTARPQTAVWPPHGSRSRGAGNFQGEYRDRPPPGKPTPWLQDEVAAQEDRQRCGEAPLRTGPRKPMLGSHKHFFVPEDSADKLSLARRDPNGANKFGGFDSMGPWKVSPTSMNPSKPMLSTDCNLNNLGHTWENIGYKATAEPYQPFLVPEDPNAVDKFLRAPKDPSDTNKFECFGSLAPLKTLPTSMSPSAPVLSTTCHSNNVGQNCESFGQWQRDVSIFGHLSL